MWIFRYGNTFRNDFSRDHQLLIWANKIVFCSVLLCFLGCSHQRNLTAMYEMGKAQSTPVDRIVSIQITSDQGHVEVFSLLVRLRPIESGFTSVVDAEWGMLLSEHSDIIGGTPKYNPGTLPAGIVFLEEFSGSPKYNGAMYSYNPSFPSISIPLSLSVWERDVPFDALNLVIRIVPYVDSVGVLVVLEGGRATHTGAVLFDSACGDVVAWESSMDLQNVSGADSIRFNIDTRELE